MLDRANAIYPVFVDNMPYESWKQDWNGNYTIPAPTIDNSRNEYFQLVATGLGTTSRWTIDSGSLPDGLTLGEDNGQIRGTATRTGDFYFRVKVESGGLTAYRDLALTAHSYRAKWHKEARCGITVSMGLTMYPQVESSLAGIANLESRFNQHFDAAAWVSQIKSLGFKFVTFSAFSGDSLKRWPSTSVYEGKRNFSTVTDYVRLLGEACHAQGLHFTVYFAADSFSTRPVYQSQDPLAPDYSTDPGKFYDPVTKLFGIPAPMPDNNKEQPNADPVFLYKWGQRNTALIRELSLMEYVDGYWFDVGATDPLLENVSSDLARWNNLWPLIRANNPFQIVGINNGYGALGNLWQYPHIDYTVFEGMAVEPWRITDDERRPYSRPINLENAVPYSAQKKMSIESTNTMDVYWAVTNQYQTAGTLLKSFESLRDSMVRNWDAGATYNLAVCVQPDGELMIPANVPLLNQLGVFLNSQDDISEAPRQKLTGQLLSMSTQNTSSIHYTLDNSRPTVDSPIYVQPITLSKSTVARAISVESGKLASVESTLTYNTQSSLGASPLVKLFDQVEFDSNSPQSKPYYRGMVFTVGQNPIELYKIGRKYTGSSGSRRLVIKQFADNWTVLFDTFDGTVPVDADGYQYSNVAKTILQAGMRYYVAIQESTSEVYASNSFAKIPETNYISIVGHKVLSINADPKPIPSDLLGQFLNLKFKVLPEEEDLARGKPATFKRPISPFPTLDANAETLYSFNVNDGDLNTVGQAKSLNGDYLWMIEINLLTVRKIRKVVLRFFNNNSPLVSLSLGLVENDFSLLEVKANNANNDEDHIIFEFNPVYAQYVYARILKPDGPDQVGAGTTISAFEIYG